MAKRARSSPASARCSGKTRTGNPCRARAVAGSDPPACAAHARRDAAEGKAERTPGFYNHSLSPRELGDLVQMNDSLSIDDEIACARVGLRRALEYLVQSATDQGSPLSPSEYARMLDLCLQATRTIARLLRDRRALGGEAADGISGAIAQVIDELFTEWAAEP